MTLRPPQSFAPGPKTGGLPALEYELMQEKAATLGRLARNFEQALAALAEFDRASGAGGNAPAEREQLLDEAGEALWCFLVQREACGLRNSEGVLREYRVPAAVRRRIGVVRRRCEPR